MSEVKKRGGVMGTPPEGTALMHTLLVMGVKPHGAILFAVQLQQHADDPSTRKESVEGWVRLTLPKAQFVRELGVGLSTIGNYIATLEEIGFVQRPKEGGTTFDTYVRALPAYLADVASEIGTKFFGRFGYSLTNVAYGYIADEVDVEDDHAFQEWAMENMTKDQVGVFGRSHRLQQELAAARQKTSQARKHNKEKPDSQRFNRGRKRKKKEAPKFTPNGVCTRFYKRVEEMGLIPEPVDNKGRGIAKRMLAKFEPDAAVEILDFMSSEAGWSKLQATLWQFKGEPLPTIAKAHQLGAQILNVARDTIDAKRSGGARDAVEVDEDAADFG